MRYCLVVLVGIFLLSGCGKQQDLLPDVPVNFSRPLTDPSLSKLTSRGTAVVISEPGYGLLGLIIYRRTDGSYAAYDRASTVNPQKPCAVTVDDPSLTVTDPCSGAKFLLEDGSPAKAPAVRSLKEYTVRISGIVLYVSN